MNKVKNQIIIITITFLILVLLTVVVHATYNLLDGLIYKDLTVEKNASLNRVDVAVTNMINDAETKLQVYVNGKMDTEIANIKSKEEAKIKEVQSNIDKDVIAAKGEIDKIVDQKVKDLKYDEDLQKLIDKLMN